MTLPATCTCSAVGACTEPTPKVSCPFMYRRYRKRTTCCGVWGVGTGRELLSGVCVCVCEVRCSMWGRVGLCGVVSDCVGSCVDGLGCGADERTGRVRARRVGGRARRGVGERTWGGSVSCVQKVEAGHERVFVCVWVCVCVGGCVGVCVGGWVGGCIHIHIHACVRVSAHEHY